MTVSSIIPVNNHSGNSSSTTFDFDFLVNEAKELVVTHNSIDGNSTQLQVDVDYKINELGNSNGSYITFPLEQSKYEVLKFGETLTLSLDLEIKQENEFNNSDKTQGKVFEKALDYIVRILQILSRRVDRSVKIKECEDLTPDELVESLKLSEQKAQESASLANTVINNANEYLSVMDSYVDTTARQAEIVINKAAECNEMKQQIMKKTQISNCILEVPQNIKLKLNNGVLTLKAGSIVTIPNGFESDGTTLHFDYITIAEDVSYSVVTTEKRHLCYNTNNRKLGSQIPAANCSGSNYTIGSESTFYWYDIGSNLMKLTRDNGATWESGWSLPLGIYAVNQINTFNGWGYIGEVTFTHKGLKWLIPNGRNEDGTLNNIEKQTTTTIILDTTGEDSAIGFLDAGGSITTWGLPAATSYYVQDTDPKPTFINYATWYDTKNNLVLTTANYGQTWNQRNAIYTGNFIKAANSNITELAEPQILKLVQNTDLVKGSDVVETYTNGAFWYRVWSDGWIEQGGTLIHTGNTTIQFLKPFTTTNYYINKSYEGPFTGTWTGSYQAFTNKKTTSIATFGGVGTDIYVWYACGY